MKKLVKDPRLVVQEMLEGVAAISPGIALLSETLCASTAENGAAATARMQPRLGRASYLGARALGIEDGGAVAVTIWLGALTRAVADPSNAGPP